MTRVVGKIRMSLTITPAMPHHESASPISGEVGPLAVRYRQVTDLAEIPDTVALEPDEAFVVGTFELAEALIARGIDSNRIAVSGLPPSDSTYPGYVRTASSVTLTPLVPFRFDRSALVILPTYNERQNLPSMIDAIRTYLAADILVVDDNSPDGTGQLADELSRQHASVHVLHRTEKQGLGPAYIAGFQWALNRHYQSIIEMDCDFSHAPWDLPRWFTEAALLTSSTEADWTSQDLTYTLWVIVRTRGGPMGQSTPIAASPSEVHVHSGTSWRCLIRLPCVVSSTSCVAGSINGYEPPSPIERWRISGCSA